MDTSHFFSTPQPTIERATQLHTYELFSPAAIFQVGDSFVYGRIREMESPPHKTAASMRPLGYTLVAYHGPLINVWRSYPDDKPLFQEVEHDIKDVVISRAQRRNHFQDQRHEDAAHACANCVRRQFSYPWTCNDGWPMGDRSWRDRGARCQNWTDQGNAPVD